VQVRYAVRSSSTSTFFLEPLLHALIRQAAAVRPVLIKAEVQVEVEQLGKLKKTPINRLPEVPGLSDPRYRLGFHGQ
jgi:hypothetical protein